MKLKKVLGLVLSVALVASIFVGCSKPAEQTEAPAEETTTVEETTATDETAAKYEDGVYFAKEAQFSEQGWKYYVFIEVKDGKIVDAKWNGVFKDSGLDKKSLSEQGLYGMKEKGGSLAEWHEEVALVENYLVETQDPTAITYLDDNYHSDAIAGATIGVSPFFTLAAEALNNGPTTAGPYTDGVYHAEAKDFAEKSGWKETVDVTVINGNIEAVNWNGVHKDGGEDKVTRSMNGTYGMKENGGAIAAWYEQADAVEAYLLKTQDPNAITYTDGEHTDAITGATISVNGFFDLVKEALGM